LIDPSALRAAKALFYNASNHPNYNAFATLQTNGSIMAWGNSNSGGSGAPADNGYTKIYSTAYAFAALRADGSIEAWGDPDFGGTSPSGSGYTKVI
jgi:hypothetical protein